jgi:hypothetical protein
MTGAMHSIADALPSTVPAITNSWLGLSGLDSQLLVLAARALLALLAVGWLVRRKAA